MKPLRLVAVAGILVGAMSARATLVYDFSFVLSGTQPTDTPPWGRLTIDSDGTDMVKIRIDNLLPAGFGYFDKLYLNVTPPTPISIVGTPAFISGSDTDVTVASEQFDFEVLFVGGNDPSRIIPGMSGTFDVTGPGLTEDSFRDLADPHGNGKPNDVAAAFHIEQNKSADIYAKGVPVPEPASIAALAIGTIALIRRRRSAK